MDKMGLVVAAVGVVILIIGNAAYPGRETTVVGLIFLVIGLAVWGWFSRANRRASRRP